MANSAITDSFADTDVFLDSVYWIDGSTSDFIISNRIVLNQPQLYYIK